jgi:hypothetical protein
MIDNVSLGGERLGDRGERELYSAPASLSLCCRTMAPTVQITKEEKR